jgi:ABC-type Na+ transport system ATPase subunit NatA
VRRRDVVLFDERGVEELEELADIIRVHAAVKVLAGSRETCKTRLVLRKRWVEAVHDFL